MSYIKCSYCGELIDIPAELLGDIDPADITNYICDACGDDDDEVRYDYGEDDWDVDDEPNPDENDLWTEDEESAAGREEDRKSCFKSMIL